MKGKQQKEEMRDKSLSDLPLSLGEELLESFIPLLDTQGIDDELRENLEIIKKHELFKLMNNNENFKKALAWTTKSKKFDHGSAKFQIKLIDSITMAIAQELNGLSAGWRPSAKSEDMKDMQKLAKKLTNKIKASRCAEPHFLRGYEQQTLVEYPESAFSLGCERALIWLEYISNYKLEKPSRKDNAYFKRDFLDALVANFLKNDLFLSTELLGILLDTIEVRDSKIAIEPANLQKLIKDSKRRYEEKTKNLLKLKRIIGD